MAETKRATVVAVVERVSMAPPKMWDVWLLNDDHTSMEFVVLVLMQIFHRSLSQPPRSHQLLWHSLRPLLTHQL